MATVYVLIGGWNYEGYSEPVGVFSSMEKAEAAKVIEYELDA